MLATSKSDGVFNCLFKSYVQFYVETQKAIKKQYLFKFFLNFYTELAKNSHNNGVFDKEIVCCGEKCGTQKCQAHCMWIRNPMGVQN